MFNLKKFIALIGIDNRLMQMYFDKAESIGIESTFDIYHILNGDEVPTLKEIKLMEDFFDFHIKGTPFEKQYATADIDFPAKIAERNRERTKKNKENKHFGN